MLCLPCSFLFHVHNIIERRRGISSEQPYTFPGAVWLSNVTESDKAMRTIAVVSENWDMFDKHIPVRIQCCFNVYTTSTTLRRRRMNVKMTSCAYWNKFSWKNPTLKEGKNGLINLSGWAMLLDKIKVQQDFETLFQFLRDHPTCKLYSTEMLTRIKTTSSQPAHNDVVSTLKQRHICNIETFYRRRNNV